MSTLKVEETVEVGAPPDKVWRFLLSPEDIVTCLPGAGLDEVEDERNFHGNMKVKVGPVTVAYKGKATLTEIDEANHAVTMVGEGREKGGAGKVKMTMNSRIEATEGGSVISVVADVELAGKVVRFGRGMMQGVSKQVFKEFGARLRSKLEVEDGAPADAAATAAPEASADAAAPEAAIATDAAAADAAAADASAATDAADPADTADTKRPAPAEDTAPTKIPAKREEPEALDGVGLVFKVMWLGFVNFFRRLFGLPERS